MHNDQLKPALGHKVKVCVVSGENMSLISDTSGESRGPMHSCNDCNTKECSNLAPEEIVDGVVGFLSFCPNWLALSFPGPKIKTVIDWYHSCPNISNSV